MLSDEQLAHWKAFGFLVLRGVFPPAEMDEIGREFDSVMDEELLGQPFTGEETKTVLWFVERRPVLTRLAEDDRVYKRIERILGPGFIWGLSDGNLYVGDTQWHGGEGEEPMLRHVKVAIYPDPVTVSTGCLRVIAGSHFQGYQRHLKALGQRVEDPDARPFGLAGAEVPGVPLESNPGDMVFFSEDLWHSSFGGQPGRRMFTLIYYENPNTEERRAWLRERRKTSIAMFRPHDSFFNSGSPRIQGMVEAYQRL